MEIGVKDACAEREFYDATAIQTASQLEPFAATIGKYFRRYRADLERHFAARAGVRAIELGAGSCTLSLLVSREPYISSVTCLDVSLHRMQTCVPAVADIVKGDTSKLRLVQGDFSEQLPFADGEFDLVAFDAALHHAHSIWHTLRECRRILSTGGLIVAQREQFLGKLTGGIKLRRLLQSEEVINGVAENAYTREQYEYYLKANGFDVRFLAMSETLLQKALLPVNGWAFSKWVILGTPR